MRVQNVDKPSKRGSTYSKLGRGLLGDAIQHLTFSSTCRKSENASERVLDMGHQMMPSQIMYY